MFEAFIEQLKIALQQPLPGEKAHFLMSPSGRRNFPNPLNYTKASVLILIFPVNNQPWVVFIKRSVYDGAHSGQISFPGGKFENMDISLQQTALRETSEELGVSESDIHIIGKLSCLKIPVSGFEVWPFVGYTKLKPIWKPDNDEVASVIETPLNIILSEESHKRELWKLNESLVEVPYYLIKEEKIWGATAMILSEFQTIIQELKNIV